ncbi:hypothetical protein BSKO_00709 [Bryopsis sp. KO-2023]|nr:hypothetical protein BSKO_00709 [Bryopsis sp. KO-2023]
MANPGSSGGQGYQQTVKLSDLTDRVVEGAYDGLKQVLDGLPSQPEAGRARHLMQYVHDQKQKILRLRMLVQWANKAKAVNACARAWGVAGGHSDAFRFAADHMAYLHEELMHLAIPAFDVHTAWEVLTTGSFDRLPTLIGEMCPPKPLSEEERHRALNRVNHLIYCHLEKMKLPKGMQLVRVSEGVATFRSNKEYEAEMTLVGAPPHLDKKSVSKPKEAMDDRSRVRKTGLAPDEGPSSLADDANEGRTEVSEQQGEETVVKERWWWRLMKLKLMTASSKGPQLHEEDHELLKQEIDIRMCMAQEAVAVKEINAMRMESHGQASTRADDTNERPGQRSGGKSIEEQQCSSKKKKKRAREIDEECQAPIVLAHDMLREISTRLLLNAIRKELLALVKKGFLWEGRVKLAVANHLKPGYRLYYWMDTPLVTDSMLKGKQAKTQSPYLEIGTSESGRVVLQHFPELPKRLVKERLKVVLDPVKVDVELMVLRSAAQNSQIIMGVLHKALDKMKGKEEGERSVRIHYWMERLKKLKAADREQGKPELPAKFDSTDLGSPIVDMFDGQDLLLKVSLHLHDGKFVLEVGPGVEQHLTKEIAAALRVEQDRVNQFWKRWSNDPPANTTSISAVTAFDKVSERLWSLVQRLKILARLNLKLRLKFSLAENAIRHSSFTIGPKLIEKYLEQHPDCPIRDDPRNLQLELASVPLSKQFPLLKKARSTVAQKAPRVHHRFRDGKVRFHPMMRSVKDIRAFLNVKLDVDDEENGFALILLGVDEWGVPVEIMRCIPVPISRAHCLYASTLTARPNLAPKTGAVSTFGGKIKPQSCGGKRKRLDVLEEEGPDPKRHNNGCIPIDDNNGILLDEMDTVSIGEEDIFMPDANGNDHVGMEDEPCWREPEDPFQDVIQWCHQRMTWEHLLLQLKALGIYFWEEHSPGGDLPASIRIAGWKPAMAVSPCKDPEESCDSTRGVDICFGFNGLESVSISVPQSRKHGTWTVHLRSRHLDGVCMRGIEKQSWGIGTKLVDGGLELCYSALEGGTIAVAFRDLVRIGRTQRFVSILRSMSQEHGGEIAGRGKGMSWTWPCSNHLRVDRVGLSCVEFVVEGGAPATSQNINNMASEAAAPSTAWNIRYTVEWSAVSYRKIGEGRSMPKNKEEEDGKTNQVASSSAGFAGKGNAQRRGVERKGEKDSRSVCKTSEVSAKPEMAAGEGKEQDTENVEDYKVRCAVRSNPPLPDKVLSELCDMVEMGESGFFLDAIGTVSGSLLSIAQALQPETLKAAKLPPGALTLISSTPPYRFKLLLSKGERRIATDVQLFSHGISYLGIDTPRNTVPAASLRDASAPAPDQGDESSSMAMDLVPDLQKFVARVSELPGVQACQQTANSGPGGRVGYASLGFGVWCRAGTLLGVLKQLMGTLVHW